MSNPESFIEEVTEEVRRDRTMALMKRWGPVALAVVVVIVGGAAWNEWQKASAQSQAQAFGDALITALGGEDIAARRDAIAAVEPAREEQQAILALLNATALNNGEGGDPAAARARLLQLAETPGLAPLYRDIANLKAIMLGGTGDAAQDAAILETLALPGAPFRPLAIEQQAVQAMAAGDMATAVTLLRALTEDATATADLRRRAAETIVALGASPDPA
ncbi:hypothetical protein [Jannaschia seohaensis]|uniref:Tetratricopeptide repeat-like domain-containing protein n=1 Tax=Jannaschia seohaensis TaxID=475081 RepID=A0A2Y9AAH9_9RHOB|nr:hypothetical protein [Jannaschia seohaensis]PWJ21171.1 hypothetical protein BCF38_102421 [Jannaschia seohaensis]SSA41581.1 hypothetical protein SAMN05421539_102421 [Jannaschia seohaensis]